MRSHEPQHLPEPARPAHRSWRERDLRHDRRRHQPPAGGDHNDDRFRWIGARNEEHAAYAAAAQSEPTRQIGVCAPKPFIIDAIVSAGELTVPPHVDIKEAWGLGMSKVKEGLKGDHDVWKQWRDEFRAAVIL